jgi:hypothetical protein
MRNEAETLGQLLSIPSKRWRMMAGPRVYFVGPEAGPIKIGYTGDLRDRMSALQCGSPQIVLVWAAPPGDRTEEWLYHQRFAARRLHGEWFERCPEIEAAIDHLREVHHQFAKNIQAHMTAQEAIA